MVRVLIILALIGGFFAVRGWKRTPVAQRAKLIKQFALVAGVMMLLVLVVSGRLNVLFGAIGMLAAFAYRSLPTVLRVLPQLRQLWRWFHASKAESPSGAPATAKMTEAQALDVLGLKPGASDDDIILAHRKLISRLHPDRGGSDYLAAQINLAKKLLMKK